MEMVAVSTGSALYSVVHLNLLFLLRKKTSDLCSI